MMTEITRDQATALAALVSALRPTWDQPGILKALSAARAKGSAFELARAALAAAEDPKVRTPAVIAMAGDHWVQSRPMGTRLPPRRLPCPEHPEHDEATCPEHQYVPAPTTVRAALRGRNAS